MVNIVAALTIESLRDFGTPRLDLYEAALTAACEESPPPFGRKSYGEKYRHLAVDPQWMAVSLITNAEREGDGATRLWNLAACTLDAEIASQVKQHAIDESRHSQWYVTMLDLTFPGAVDASLRPHLKALSPGYTSQTPLKPMEGSPFAHELTVDDLIQMNIAEIRTRIHHLLQRPVLMALCGAAYRAKLLAILDPLLLDETRHIDYTARLIDRFAHRDGRESVQALLRERMQDFNQITEVELANATFQSS